MSATPRTAAPLHKKRGVLIAVAIAVVAIALILFHILRGNGGGKQERMRGMMQQAQVVNVAEAKTGDMPIVLSETGTVTPTATVTVLPQLSGYLTEVAYKEGQEVQKGQFLAQIDPRQYLIDKLSAEAQLAKDEATLAQARADAARYATLNTQQLIAEQTYANQKFAVQQAEAAVKADKAAIAQADLNIAYCRITAPVSGRAGLRLVDVGNYVTSSSSTGIVVITTDKPMPVQFNVAQNDLAPVLQRFNSGAKLPVEIWNSDNSKRIAIGELYAIGNQMASGTGTVGLRALAPNDDGALFPNEFVNVKLTVDTLKDAVLVPTSALRSGVPGDYVFVANADDTVSVQKVKLGPSDGANTVIANGLKPGQRVVIDGMDRLSDGAKIKLAGAKPAPDEGATAGAGKHGGHGRAQAQ